MTPLGLTSVPMLIGFVNLIVNLPLVFVTYGPEQTIPGFLKTGEVSKPN
jgi:hypothetical protein